MKIIDLLNKIANGEIDKNNKYQFSRDDYCTINDFFARYIVDEENLNLEILEEKKIPEKIEVFGIHYDLDFIDYKDIEVLKNYLNKDFQTIYDALDLIIKNQNKLIDYIKAKENKYDNGNN